MALSSIWQPLLRMREDMLTRELAQEARSIKFLQPIRPILHYNSSIFACTIS